MMNQFIPQSYEVSYAISSFIPFLLIFMITLIRLYKPSKGKQFPQSTLNISETDSSTNL